jgi:hypothetical protein
VSDRTRALELVREARDLWRQDDVADKVTEAEQWLAAHDTARAAPVDAPVASH